MTPASMGHSQQMPEPPQLTCYDVEKQWFYAELLLMTEILTSSLKESPTNLQRNIFLSVCICTLVLLVNTQSFSP